jgi:chromobox protein 1
MRRVVLFCAHELELTCQSTAPIENISDEESGDIPFDNKNGTTEDANEADQVEADDEEDDDEEEEEEEEEDVYVAHADKFGSRPNDLTRPSYVVEKIMEHAWMDDVS